jgi:alanyl aminopeptidase
MLSPRCLLPALALSLALPTAPAQARPPRPTATAAATAVPPMRLTPQVRPLASALDITVDPAQPGYQGTVVVDLVLDAPQRALTLHAKGLTLTRIELATGAHTLAGRSRRVDAERVQLQFPRALPAGKLRLTMAFAGTLQEKDVDGFFRQRDGQGWLAATQFEPTGARLAFPAFDEPGWKLPWTLTLTVPEALTAVANTPVALTEPAERPQWKRVRFAPTPPLPSYLVAWAVGDLDTLEAPAHDGLPIRFHTPRGRSAEAAYAAQITPPVIAALEGYFGMPFPYAKADSLALPVTVNFGAMENPGLITYAARLLLARPDAQSPQFKRDLVATAAHELAHQWFGNLVTLAWWDDLWLNESFASWLGDRITAEVMPAWGWHLATQQARSAAMAADRLVSARRIQQPVRSDDDLGHLFDTITYQKGQTVLAMFEAWLGAERFQAGVRRYMQRHAWGHATGDDFLAALGEADPALPAALRSFTTQPGIPLLTVALDCADGAPPRLQLRQQRLLPLGAVATPAMAGQRWQLPVQVRTPGGEARLLMTTPEATLPLPDATCPTWVQANAGGHGYYRVAYAADGLQRLAAQPTLGDAEAMALLDDARGLHQAGRLDTAALLALVQRFAAHPRRDVRDLSAAVLAHLQPLAEPAQRDAYAAAWQTAFGAQARALGWLPRPGDDDDAALQRQQLLPRVADLGEDSALRAQARTLAQAWLADRNALPPAARGAVLAGAALDADAALVDALLAATRATADRPERADLLAALGRVRDPALAARVRTVLLDPAIDIRDSLWPLLGGQVRQPEGRSAVLAFLQQNRPALLRRLGRDEPGALPELFTGACSPAERQAVAQAFGPEARRYQGGSESLTRTLEAISLCSAWRAQQAWAW